MSDRIRQEKVKAGQDKAGFGGLDDAGVRSEGGEEAVVEVVWEEEWGGLGRWEKLLIKRSLAHVGQIAGTG